MTASRPGGTYQAGEDSNLMYAFTGGRCARRFSAAAWPLVVLLVWWLMLGIGTSESAFSAATVNSSNGLGVAVLHPAASFAASRPCSRLTPAWHASNSGLTASATSLSLTTPATSVGDYLILSVTTYVNGTPAGVNTPAGWTWMGANTSNNGTGTKVEINVFAMPAPSSPPASYTITFTGTTAAYAALTSYSNASALDGWVGNFGSTSSATATGQTTTAPNELLLAIYAHTGSTSSTPTGMSLSVGLGNITAGLHQYHQVLPTAGTATGDKASTISATSPGWASFSIMLLPPYDPTVTLTWTATTDTWATGYEVARSPGSTTSVSGQSTTTWTDTTTAAATGYTYTIKSVYGTWRSTPQAATVAHC